MVKPIDARTEIRAARNAANAGDLDTAVAGLAEVAKLDPARVPLDVRMRFFEVFGALEAAGHSPASIRERFAAAVRS